VSTRQPRHSPTVLPPPAFRGNCVCGRWTIVPESATVADPVSCECGLSFFFADGTLSRFGKSDPEMRLDISSRPADAQQAGYVTACFTCGATSDLMMVAHRNDDDRMVGWIFTCADCFDEVDGVILVTMEFAEHYINQMGRWVKAQKEKMEATRRKSDG
jgi:hypothetical protein